VGQRAVAPALERYCGQHRTNELIIVGGDDQFYAADLPIARLRYSWIQKPRAAAPKPPLNFAWLGINVTVPEFNRLDALVPTWRQRLADFGLPSDAPVATVISAASTAEIRGLIAAHPQTDFWIPNGLLGGIDLVSPHKVEPAGGNGVFLLAPQSGTFATSRPCHL
jgi:hypothetical protein